MRTEKERSRLIAERTSILKRERARRRRIITDAVSAAVCVVIIVLLGVLMPSAVPGVDPDRISASVGVAGAAGMITGRAWIGYVFMGVLSFLLGVCLTIFLYRLKDRHRTDLSRNDRGDADGAGENEKKEQKKDDEF